QLMPATAKQTAQRHGVKYTSRQQLIDPETNIQLGTAYLSSMLQLFNNNRILASAAYNAGPTRVRGWLNPELPLDIWIETIPFKETRNYVQNVLMFTSIYARRLNQTLPMIDPSEWRDFYQPEASTPTSESTPGKS
ncbi:lytic transglycosylase domain-containing protein, partial [Pseudomonadales bacterium]|nr:lytic transglycosylase domain-containing protein [Pseudomonadales bacterium]